MQPKDILEIGNFMTARILFSAVDLDIFKQLNDPSTSAEVASATQLNEEFATRLMNSLVAMGVLNLADGRYSIPDSLKVALGYDNHSMIPMLKHRSNLWRTWSQLDDIVRAGKNYYDLTGEGRRGGDTFDSFIRAMAVSGRAVALETVAKLDLTGVKRFLDIGGGPATYVIEFCRALPDAEFFILDVPGVKEIATDFLTEAGMQDRVKFIIGDSLVINPGDVVSDEGEKFDMIFSSNLIHAFSYEKTRLFVERSGTWVAPGGQIAVKDFYLNDDRVTPARAAMFDINMLVNTPGGRCYTWGEIELMLSGLKDSSGNDMVENLSRIEITDDISGISVAKIKS